MGTDAERRRVLSFRGLHCEKAISIALRRRNYRSQQRYMTEQIQEITLK
jgi:hypothetical protein